MAVQKTQTSEVKVEDAADVDATAAAVRLDLPDLARLSLGGNDRADATPVNGIPVHVAIHTHGAPTVTVNVYHGGAGRAEPETPPRVQGGAATPRRIRFPPQNLPAASPSRIRLTGALPAVQGRGGHHVQVTPAPAATPVVVPADTAAPAAAHLSPLLAGLGIPSRPNSPELQSVPNSPASAVGVQIEDYEYIAPRDGTHTRWYVVTAGRRVGIWREWVDMAHYVTRVPGNLHKSFDLRADAEAHYYTNKAMGHVEVIMP